jgi:hypothetical protein
MTEAIKPIEFPPSPIASPPIQTVVNEPDPAFYDPAFYGNRFRQQIEG